MRIHATDTTGQNLELNNSDMVEKYSISEEAYNNRPGFYFRIFIYNSNLLDSVRAIKKKLLAEKMQTAEEEISQGPDPNQLAAANIKVKMVDHYDFFLN